MITHQISIESQKSTVQWGVIILKRLLNKKIFASVILLTMLFSLFISNASVQAATVIIAASNSSSTWKSQATVICTGTNDQTTINTYLTGGNTVELAPGTFNCSGLVVLATGNTLYGQGNTTILNMQNNNGGIYMGGVSNIEVGSLEIAGNQFASYGLVVGLDGHSSVNNFYFHDITDIALGGDDFVVYANNGTISNISFIRCDANNPDGYGYLVNGAGSPSLVQDITFYKCTVENAGVASTRTDIWVVGFDFAEYPGLTVNRLQAINCTVNGALESDFHSEVGPTKTNWVITDCSASSAGLKPGGAFYGAGYLIASVIDKDDIVLSNNTASNNKATSISWGAIPDEAIWDNGAGEYAFYSPPQNMVVPSSSTKVASRISQSNCKGLLVTDGNYKNLYIFSSDGNVVNQQIDLGAVYAANDGKSYSFNGSKITVQFSDYAVIRLVKTTSTTLVVTTGSLTNGTVGTSYSQTLTATGGISPYTWAITSGTLPAGLSLSSGGVISGTPTTTGGPGSLTFRVTDTASATATKSISITINNSTLSITASSLPNATVGIAYSQTLTATGGTSPYTWSIASGSLPAGLTLSSTGVISGNTTTEGGPVSITFKVTDRTGANATKIIPITVANTNCDINKDGAINILDMTSITQHWGETGTPSWIPQDVNNDGIINSLDMIIVGQHWTP